MHIDYLDVGFRLIINLLLGDGLMQIMDPAAFHKYANVRVCEINIQRWTMTLVSLVNKAHIMSLILYYSEKCKCYCGGY